MSFEREKRFTADAAHELRTPVAALSIHLENALNTASHDTQTPLFLAIDSSKHITRLIEQLLILARTTPEHYLTRFQSVDLTELCREVIAEQITSAMDKQQLLSLEREKPLILSGDRSGLKMMVGNLLSNAIRYTPTEGEITITLSDEGDDITLLVTDSGPGIPEDQYDRVFDRFYRVNGDQHSSGVEGSGLGLAIVKDIVVLHGGGINLHSTNGHNGLTAEVKLLKQHQRHNTG